MAQQEQIRQILDSLSVEELKWNFSENWLEQIEKRCSENLTKNKVKIVHRNLINELAKDLFKFYRSQDFSNTISDDTIEGKAYEGVLKALNPESKYNPKESIEKTYVSRAVRNLLLNVIKKEKKYANIDELENIESVSEYQTLKTSFIYDVQDIDGDIYLPSFLKYKSIIEKKKVNNRDDVKGLNFKLDTTLQDGVESEDYFFVPNYLKYKSICNRE